MESIQRQRYMVQTGAAMLLILALAFPWVEAWPVANPAALVLQDPVYQHADIYPHFFPRGWWTFSNYESVTLHGEVVLLELLAIWSGTGWALCSLARRAERLGDPLYCERALDQPSVSSGSSGTVGPLG